MWRRLMRTGRIIPNLGQEANSNRLVARFLGRFVTAWLLGILILSLLPAIEAGAVQGTVASLAATLRLLPVEVRVTPPVIHVMNRISVEIVPDCTPLLPVLALWAAIAAFPSSLGWKTVGAIGGATVLWIFNLVRLLALVPLLIWAPSLYSFSHLFLLQTAGLLVVCALYVLWIRLQNWWVVD